jgi:hypothetical protein
VQLASVWRGVIDAHHVTVSGAEAGTFEISPILFRLFTILRGKSGTKINPPLVG